MKETDIIDPVRIGKFSLGYFRWSVTAHIFQPKRFWKYCTKQVYEWKRGLSLQFISLTGIYTLLMFIFHTDGQPFITSSGAQMLIWLGFFIYIAKSSSSLADQIGIRSKRVVYLIVPVSTAEKYIAHLLSTIVLYPLLFFAAIVVAQYASELISSTIRGEMFNREHLCRVASRCGKTVGLPRYSLLPPYLAQSRHSHSAPHCGRRTAS